MAADTVYFQGQVVDSISYGQYGQTFTGSTFAVRIILGNLVLDTTVQIPGNVFHLKVIQPDTNPIYLPLGDTLTFHISSGQFPYWVEMYGPGSAGDSLYTRFSWNDSLYTVPDTVFQQVGEQRGFFFALEDTLVHQVDSQTVFFTVYARTHDYRSVVTVTPPSSGHTFNVVTQDPADPRVTPTTPRFEWLPPDSVWRLMVEESTSVIQTVWIIYPADTFPGFPPPVLYGDSTDPKFVEDYYYASPPPMTQGRTYRIILDFLDQTSDTFRYTP
jgi:hypothetical protein